MFEYYEDECSFMMIRSRIFLLKLQYKSIIDYKNNSVYNLEKLDIVRSAYLSVLKLNAIYTLSTFLARTSNYIFAKTIPFSFLKIPKFQGIP